MNPSPSDHMYMPGVWELSAMLLSLAFCSEEPAMAKNPTSKHAPNTVVAFRVPSYEPINSVSLDGTGHDGAWRQAAVWGQLVTEHGGAGQVASNSKVRLVRAGKWLLIAMDADEGDGIVAAQAMHGQDLWRDDAMIVQFEGARSLQIYANPLGSLCCYEQGRKTMGPVTAGQVQSAARVAPARWRVEIAVDLTMLVDPDKADGLLRLRIARQRQQRGLDMFQEPSFPPKGAEAMVLLTGPPNPAGREVSLNVAPAQRFAGRRALVAALSAKPPATAGAWAKMPVTMLAAEDGREILDPDFQHTEVRACVTHKAVILHITCHEANGETIVDSGDALWDQDSLEVFLGPDRYNYVQFLVNSRGRKQAALGKSGGRRIRTIAPPESVTVKAGKSKTGNWTVRLSIPTRAVTELVGAPSDGPGAAPWRVQITRYRPARKELGQTSQLSVLSVMNSANSHCPARFADLRVVQASTRAQHTPRPPKGGLPAPVLDRAKRKAGFPGAALDRWIDARNKAYDTQHAKAFAQVGDRQSWEAHAVAIRENLSLAAFPASGGEIPERGSQAAEIVYDLPGDGFAYQGLILASKGAVPIPATLYVPQGPARSKRPVLIMFPAHHTGRNSQDLIVLGANFARAGGVAVAMESIGSGRRAVAEPWAHKNHQRNLIGGQVLLAGDNIAGWTALEVSRVVDYLLSRKDVDGDRIAIVGGVAGGGDVTALAAALDDRIDVSIPFNFATTAPMDAWYDPLRSYHGARAGGFSPWAVDAVIAPRKLIQAQEFAWGAAPKAWHDRFKKVYEYYGATDNLAYVHGGPNTHATHYHAVHRLPMYRILNKWFSMALPTRRRDEFQKVISRNRLDCFDSPKGRQRPGEMAVLPGMIEPHELARSLASERLASAREARRGLKSPGPAIAAQLDRVMGDTSPVIVDQSTPSRKLGTWRGIDVEGLYLPAEAGQADLGIGILLLKPAIAGPSPAVLGICRSGGRRFLARRGDEIETLLKAGIALCLADLRGCGVTSPGKSRFPEGPAARAAYRLWALNDSLPARQLKDARTALAYLAGRADIDPQAIALWGEGFSRPNALAGEGIVFDEVAFRQVSPTPLEQVEPMGGMLAMMAALRPVQAGERAYPIRAVLVRGALVSFMSVMDRRHYYLPVDAIVPGLLRVADMGDLAAALQAGGTTLLAEDLRDGGNRVVGADTVNVAWPPAGPVTYRDRPSVRAIPELIDALTAFGAGKSK